MIGMPRHRESCWRSSSLLMIRKGPRRGPVPEHDCPPNLDNQKRRWSEPAHRRCAGDISQKTHPETMKKGSTGALSDDGSHAGCPALGAAKVGTRRSGAAGALDGGPDEGPELLQVLEEASNVRWVGPVLLVHRSVP